MLAVPGAGGSAVAACACVRRPVAHDGPCGIATVKLSAKKSSAENRLTMQSKWYASPPVQTQCAVAVAGAVAEGMMSVVCVGQCCPLRSLLLLLPASPPWLGITARANSTADSTWSGLRGSAAMTGFMRNWGTPRLPKLPTRFKCLSRNWRGIFARKSTKRYCSFQPRGSSATTFLFLSTVQPSSQHLYFLLVVIVFHQLFVWQHY